MFVVLRVEEQTISAAELITQDIDINEPIGNLKKLLEPRLQVQLDGYDICLQDILVCDFVVLSLYSRPYTYFLRLCIHCTTVSFPWAVIIICTSRNLYRRLKARVYSLFKVFSPALFRFLI